MKTFRILLFAVMSLVVLKATSEPHLRRLGGEAGLTNNYVMGIAQDRNGFVWIATESGLNRFDGEDFKAFKAGEGSIAANELNRIVSDRVTNSIWICTQRHGLDILDCDSYTFTHFNPGEGENDLASNGITDVFPTEEGNAWVSTYTSGLDFIERQSGKVTHHNSSSVKGWPDDKLWTVVATRDGKVYLGHVDAGFSIYEPSSGKISNFRHSPADAESLPGDEVRALLADRQGNIWVGTNRGLALFDPKRGRFKRFGHSASDRNSLVSDNIYHLYQTRDGRIWISTENGGVSIMDPREALTSGRLTFTNLTAVPDEGVFLSNKTIHTTFEDKFGNIWIGTYGDGIDILCHMESQLSHRHKNSFRNPLSDNSVMSVCTVGDTLYVGTDGIGTDVFVNGRYLRNINASNSPLEDNAVLALMKGPRGEVWMGTYEGDVVVCSPDGRVKSIEIPDAIDVRCFARKPDGTVIAGTGRGLAEIAPSGTITTRYASDGKINDEWIRSVVVTPEGDIWVGSFGNGISVYDSSYRKKYAFGTWNGLRTNTVNQILRSADGKIWAASGEGVVCFTASGDMVKAYRMADGLPDNVVKSLCEDSHSNLWMTTGVGISMISPEGKISSFSQGRGIGSSDFRGGCAARDADGRIIFGSHDGLFSFNPEWLSANIPLPPPVVTGVTVYGEHQGADDKEIFVPKTPLKLDYTENTLRVDFGILDPSVAPAIIWTYNVEGVDNRWLPVSPESGILLRELPPGDYRLAIKASVPNQTDEAVTVLPFTINPPLWATWWAKSLYALIIALLIWYGLRFYRKRLDLEYDLALERKKSIHQRELNAEKLRFFTNITHELRTPLTLILGPLEDMKSDRQLTPAQAGKIGMVHKSALRLLDLINTILEFRKTETQNRHLTVDRADLASLVNEIGVRYHELNTNRELAVSTEIEPGDYTLWFDRETVNIIIDNLMSNACKYTVSGKVTLKLSHTSESGVPFTEVSVSDTGLGVDHDSLPHIFDRYYRDSRASNRLGTGIGLALVYNLVQLHQGEIFVDSEPGKGSTFRFRLQTENCYPNAPRAAVKETGASTPDPQPEISEQTSDLPRVLVVDDDIDILSYISGILDGKYIVDTATDGKDGLEKAREKMPDIIVSDVMMPKMDGMDMVRKLKESPETSHIPVVIVTAKIAEEARLEAYESGADSFITKPFSSKLLLARLKNILVTRHMRAAQSVESHISGNSQEIAESPSRAPEGGSDGHSATSPAETAAENPIVSKLTVADEAFLSKVGKIISDNITGENLDVGYIAGEMCMSHSTLYRKVKAITGMSVARLIRKYRARRAAELMRTGNYTVSEIAMMVGMGSMGNFRQCFREEFNSTPTEYLRSQETKA